MDEDPFSVWGLRPVELADRDLLTAYLASLADPLSDYTFAQLYTWRNSLRILWKQIRGHLCVFANGAGDLTLLLPPIGDGNSDAALAEAFALMDAYNADHGVPGNSRVEYASDELLARFDRAGFVAEPMGFDYLYDVGRMIDLAGGDLASKRQAKNRFMRNYAHRVEPYSAARHLVDCRRLLEQWKRHQDAGHALAADDAGGVKRLKEATAADLCLETAETLGLKGLVVYVAPPGQPEAPWTLGGFTFGEPVGRDQSSITIEKTDLTVKGLAQFIFSEFCRVCWSDRPLVNVGDDWGLETLAWTKMSYRPVRLLQKYVLRKAPIVAAAMPAPLAGLAPMAEVAPMSGAAPETEFKPETELRAMAPFAPRVEFAPEAATFESMGMPRLAGTSPLPITVRVADKRDVPAALELERACFSPSVSLKKRQLQYLQQRRSAVFLVAEQAGALRGEGIALVRQHRSGVTGRIYSLAVDRSCRGRGVGDRLLGAMLEALAERGARRAYLEVEADNASAIRLYQRRGFRSIGDLPDYYGQGRSALHMMAEIPRPAGVLAGV